MTSTLDLPSSSVSGARGSQFGEQRRGPPKAIQLLLPIWGVPFIAQFLQVSLPTILAPGNLPALAKALPCKFVFLTDSQGAEILDAHAGIQYLRTVCQTDIEIIDDLITGDNYSTTITLAYARAVRAADKEMLDTCFFFMIADYIIADGSLANVLTRMQAGYSGILAGNFQVVEEDAKEDLFKSFESGAPNIAIKPRSLMKWALRYLHSMTIANTVNFPLCFSTHSNRLFWRVDENTLIGRFYLMHMICIRPETTDFTVGSSCDYSFVPEMCPSGNVHVMVDSDEYLVVEMQRRSHEDKFVRLGQVNRADLVASLAEWTTKRHRLNAHFPVVFHVGDPSPALRPAVTESRKFIEEIEADLPAALSHHDHPYWIGAFTAHRREVERRRKLKDPSYVPNADVIQGARYSDFLYRCRDLFFGRPPHVRPWHPRWPDYQMIEGLVLHNLTKIHGRTLVLSSAPLTFRSWLGGVQRTVESLDFYKILELDADGYEQLVGKFDGCFLVLKETEILYVPALLKLIWPLLSVDDRLLVFVLNGHGLTVGRQFNQDMVAAVNGFLHPGITVEDAKFVAAGWSTWVALRGIRRMYISIARSPFYIPLTALPLGFLTFLSLVGNFVGRRVRPQPPSNELCSSVGIVMRVTAQAAALSERRDRRELDIASRRFKKDQPAFVPVQRAEPV